MGSGPVDSTGPVDLSSADRDRSERTGPAGLQTDTENVDPAERYQEWIAELRGRGVHVGPATVVRMSRLRNGRLVWLEKGGSRGRARAYS
ncbi:hypothetical protein UA75_03705 [Actinoalloteichus sp. GBA129-24]|uniref:Uncharacterized protein n=1 Tax=Actinoalloteichus fjordicus TaxID=1612552 RepID=A0AAC9PQC9_9PSEU|nr:hypothetical protein UA74_03605 [Actinoalloteichus fjordicus]APU18774.1 hypothetical protein UA75_03705 [Actinoalloteichus sp. GBA129-24]